MNLLYYGDNLTVLRQHVKDESVDLVYLDPPFNSNQDYNILFAEHGTKAAAQIKAFEDTWRWDDGAARAYEETVELGGRVSQAMQAFRTFLGESDMLAYLAMMAPRLVELRRTLKPTGSIYLHCDPTASHYLKMLLDAVLGPEQFRNEIIWRRTGAHGAKRTFGPIHDTLLFFSKTDDYYFKTLVRPYMRGHVEQRYTEDDTGRMKFTSGGNILSGPGRRAGESGAVWRAFDPTSKNRHWAVPKFIAEQMPAGFESLGVLAKLDALLDAGLIELVDGAAWPTPVRYLKSEDGHPVQDVWAYQPYTEGTVFGTSEGIDADVAWLGPTDPERLGYQTQKPGGLLGRVIEASCPEGGVVLDPFCGCGTTIATAEKLMRRWVGIDITHLAIGLIKHRLRDTYGASVEKTYRVIGEPTTSDGARQLAAEDKYQFQWWALGLVGARPGDEKKGADKGIDGRIYFHDEGGSAGKTKHIVLSVKGGHLKATDVRDLRGVMEREKATIGVLIALERPTAAMRKEAASAGFYTSPWDGGKYQRLQLRTVEELLAGKGIEYPAKTQTNTTFRKAPKAKPSSVQLALDPARAAPPSEEEDED